MKATITIGMPGSGKTTWAENEISEDKMDNTVIVSLDDIRTELFMGGDSRNYDKYTFNRKNESRIVRVQHDMITEYAKAGLDIIIGDTNLKSGRRENLVNLLRSLGYLVHYKYFQITWEECIKRNAQRFGGVPHHILRMQWGLWLDSVQAYSYFPEGTRQVAMIVDIDGTIADKATERGYYDWHLVGQDTPRKDIIAMVLGLMAAGYHPVFLSGRDSVCYQETCDWLSIHLNIPNPDLFMRPEGSYEKDYNVKLKLFKDHVAENYDVRIAIDDRPQVVRLWHDIGIPNVIAVADQMKEF